jgi:filamentous hemagglutinin family protein
MEGMTMNHLKRSTLPLIVAACFAAAAQAAPTSPQVVSGQATFAQQGNVFSITNTPNTIINWQSFSVNPGEVTRFLQQSESSAVLNRILGQDPSRILGALQSNGKVFLINPNGIVFGRDARVDVNGLVASTLNLADADFLSGKKNFTAGPVAGNISNQGAIATPSGGQVFLIAPNVENSGIISSPKGEVLLAAGHSVQLVDGADPDLRVVVSAPADQALNLGQLISQGGKVGIYGALVTQRGLVNANSAVMGESGQIIFKASGDTVLEAGSVTSATGAGNGGDVQVLGQRVALTGDAKVDASGATGGGSVLVGGDYQGGNARVQNAQQSWFGRTASIRADATETGKGGKVVLWSNGATRVFGRISARGGAAGGDGGMVETSGHVLDVNGVVVDAGAANGKNGSWLLDPYDITVSSVANSTVLDDVSAFGAPLVSGLTEISASLLSGSSADVILQAQHDLTFNNEVRITHADTRLIAQAGNNITVNAPIGTNHGTLSLSANSGPSSGSGSLLIKAPVTTGGGAFTGSGYNVGISSGGSVDVGGRSASLSAIAGFTLGSGTNIKSTGTVDILADSATLDGNIGGAGASLPTVSISTSSNNRNIGIVAAKTGSVLELTPDELYNIGAYELHLGNGEHTGSLSFDSLYKPGSGKLTKLVLENQGPVAINSGIDLTLNEGNSFSAYRYGDLDGAISIGSSGSIKARTIELSSDNIGIAGALNTANAANGSVHLMPHHTDSAIVVGTGSDGSHQLAIDQTELSNIATGTLTIGGYEGQAGNLTVNGAVDLSGILNPASTLTLNAGAGPLSLQGALSTPGALILESTDAISQTAALSANSLAVQGGSVSLASANSVNSVSGGATGTFQLVTNGNLSVGDITNHVGRIYLTSAGVATLNGTLDASDNFANIHAHGIRGAGLIKAGTVLLYSETGIGTSGVALRTQAGYLGAENSQNDASAPINIANVGALSLGSVRQTGSANGGSITIDNTGGMTIARYEPPAVVESSTTPVMVSATSGAIRLVTHSPLTIDGSISTTSGNISVEAGNGGALTIGSNGQLRSNSGNIQLTGGTVSSLGVVSSTSGTVSGLPGAPPPPPPPPPPPTVSDCVANPAASSCEAILQQAAAVCMAAPTVGNCVQVLALTLTSCIANPTGPNCAAVLPTFEACLSAPSTPGCSVRLPTVTACSGKLDAPGCSAVMPSLATCAANPGAAGCSAVNACLSTPTTSGCSAFLPTLASCITSPTAPGCTVVLPPLAACVANPTAPGCTIVLPPLAACIATPAAAGCAAVLPKLDACIASPTAAGCAVVLPGLAACTVNPTIAGCGVVLPSLPSCVTAPTQAGCSAVLPTLAQCINAPASAGCSVVLPSLAQCAASPTTPACAAVLPTAPFCTSHPLDPACVGLDPQSVGNVNAQVIVTGVTPANGAPVTAGGGSQSQPHTDDKPGPAVTPDSGAKNEKPTTKMYCN